MSATDDTLSDQHQELIDDLVTRFLPDYYREEIGELARKYPNEQTSLYIDYDDLYKWDNEFADDYLENPSSCRLILEEALRQYDLPIDFSLDKANVRVYNLPETLDISDTGRANQVNRLLSVRGQVQKVSKVRPKVEEAAFKCQRCESITRVPQTGDGFQEPHECRTCERNGPFILFEPKSKIVNHQYARVQEPPENTEKGQAQSIDVHMEGDIVDTFDAGDRVELTAEHKLVMGDGDSPVFDTELHGRSVIKEESSYDDIDVDAYEDEIKKIAAGEYGDPYDLLIESVNPKHHGDEDIKTAIALQLFGGWPREHPDDSRDRGDSHILLMGDPGEGKSTFLKWVDSVAPRSTFASGKGATAAGLTAAVTQDDFGNEQWGVEAGAMVLADGGVACIDEIDKVNDEAVSSLHDALETQQVQVNKAGINTTLQARAALLAAGNPVHGRFDETRPMGEQIDLSPTLLSRFDLIFLVNDDTDPDEDAAVVEHMMRSRRATGKLQRGEELTEEEEETVNPAIPPELLRAYIAFAKENCHPILPEGEAEQRLKEWFIGMRSTKAEINTPVPVTYRQEQAIERLAEASARIRLSDIVELEDVERAVSLVEASMRQVGYDPETGQFDVDIIETGQSTSQRQRRKTLIGLFEENAVDGLTRDELQEAAEKLDSLAVEKLDDDITELLKKGFIYDAGGGRYRLS